MPDSKCSENQEGCLTAEDCATGHHCATAPLVKSLQSEQSDKRMTLRPLSVFQVLSATVLLLVHTVWTLTSAQVNSLHSAPLDLIIYIYW